MKLGTRRLVPTQTVKSVLKAFSPVHRSGVRIASRLLRLALLSLLLCQCLLLLLKMSHMKTTDWDSDITAILLYSPSYTFVLIQCLQCEGQRELGLGVGLGTNHESVTVPWMYIHPSCLTSQHFHVSCFCWSL